METLLVLKQPSCNVLKVRNEFWRLFWTSKQNEWYRKIQKVFFLRSYLSGHCEYYERTFEQWSELQVAKCLIVHVLSSSNNVSSPELRNKGKATQQWSLRVTNDIVLDQVRVYHERVYADNVVIKFWFVRSFSSQHHSKFITNVTSEIVSQIRTKEWRTRSFLWKVNLIFLRSSRHFNCDTDFAVIVSFWNESVHGFNNIRNGRVKPRFQIVEFWGLW